jgi:hypothetical protein
MELDAVLELLQRRGLLSRVAQLRVSTDGVEMQLALPAPTTEDASKKLDERDILDEQVLFQSS